jgi:hypothetical protein
MRVFLTGLHLRCMNPAVMALANKSLAFSLYDLHLEGVSAKKLAAAYSVPVEWVEERIEAVRLCLKYQVKLSLRSADQATPESRERIPCHPPKLASPSTVPVLRSATLP